MIICTDFAGMSCGASQGTWTIGGGIVIPAKYRIFGEKEHKKDLHLQIMKALARLQVWTNADNGKFVGRERNS